MIHQLHEKKKKLELKKTAIAHLSLTPASMQALAGGGITEAILTQKTSRDVNGDLNTCTITGDDTKLA